MLSLLLAASVLHIDPAVLSNDIKMLASDEFEGRGPGTAGEHKTIDYLVKRFKEAGAEPAGEKGGWTQAVEMRRHTVAPERVLKMTAGTCTIDLIPDMMVWTRNSEPRTQLKDIEVVFAGHGVSAPDRGWDDYAGMDVKGKLIILVPNDPDYLAESGPFGGKRMTYYARLGTKVEEAGRRGAAAVLALFDPASNEYDWTAIRQMYAAPTNGVPGADASLVRFSSFLSEEASKRLFECAERDLSKDKVAARTAGFRAIPLDMRFSADLTVSTQKTLTHNVVAKFPGSKYPDEYFAYTAHWDHLGRGRPDKTGDEIYNGALDNAGGTAGLLSIAQAFGKGPRPQRSILLIAMTLEESGLLGSEYFASHPLVPLEKIVAGFNMDAVNLIGMTKTLEVTSMGQTTLEDHLQRELAAQGREMKDDPNSVLGFYYRSDHFPFAKRGVPFVFAGSGWELAEQKVPNTREPEVGTRYHQPMDQWYPELDFAAAARDIELYYLVGARLANSREWPRWKPGTEFEAERLKSAAVRR